MKNSSPKKLDFLHIQDKPGQVTWFVEVRIRY